MKLRRTLVLLLLCLTFASFANAASNVVISQVYGGGGNSGATYKNDFIELFNRGTAPVSLAGWSVQYASAAGTSWSVTALSGTIQPGQYYLVQEAAGTGGTLTLVPDATGGIAMSATAGKVALVSATSALTGGCPTTVDMVGFGGASCFEGSGPTPVLTNTTAALRGGSGCNDTDSNAADFATGAPVPHNTASPMHACGPVTPANAAPTIDLPASPAASVAQDAAPFTVEVSGLDDNSVYTWSATPGAGVATVAVTAGQGSAHVTYTVTLQPGFSGTATFTAALSDGVNGPATQAVNITVASAPPQALDHVVISQVYGGGGNSGATYHNDYVELYNPTTSAVDLGGWTIQYGSATGSTWQTQPLGGVISPGEYYLITLGSGGAAGATVPASNITGEINASATNGKIALSRTGDPFSGCAVGDPALVDLVGYGSTANCREGSSNASAASNTLALFRKNDGFTDTNVNGADFVTGAPNPRRTAPIVEIGPSVLNTDPRRDGLNAPKDASITVTFTEGVSADAGWYDITCATTGNHNDATVADGGNVWIITPNTNFRAGEQCTVTIFAAAIHDLDLDDAGVNADTMSASYTFSFTISTGTPPPYSSGVHLTMGNPSGAIADINVPNNYLMQKPEFAVSYNRDRGTPNWVSWHLTDEWIGDLTRVDSFRPDPAVPADWYRVLHTDYFDSGFDRGHMTPNADRDKETSIPINQATFLMSNMVPQAPDNNQGPWAAMESYLRTLLPGSELYIVSGPAGIGGTGSSGFKTTFANGHVTVPASTWKVAVVLPKADGDDVHRVTAGTRTIAVIMPNTQGIRNVDWQTYLTTVDQVEALTGYDFFANVPDAVENAIEAGVNGVNPPGVENQSISTPEDTAKSVTLEAAAANGNPLTYTIVTQPAHGTLAGSGANQTYTPLPDFNGTDTFSYRVSDGSLSSGVATVDITITAVDDAPAASLTAPSAGTEGSAISASASGSDIDADDTLTYSWTVTKDGAAYANGNGTAIAFTPDDNGSYVITATVTDAAGATGTATQTVAVTNVAPSISAVNGPSAAIVAGGSATVSVNILDAGAADTHTAVFTWDDGTSSTVSCSAGTCSASHAFTAAGTYAVGITVADDDAATVAATFQYVIVTDPRAGSVTGGGWIDTPSGRATLNVNAKYLPNAAMPSGNTQFQVAGSQFTSTSYEWLVVAGNRAQYRGTGTINGSGSYGFAVTVVDSAVDRFRIRVWDNSTGTTVYDSAPAAGDDLDTANPQALGGGNVTVH